MTESMRGHRLGSQSLESEYGVEFAQRQKSDFRCPNGHNFQLIFSQEAELPQVWDCSSCPEIAVRFENGQAVEVTGMDQEERRTHFDMVLERRSRQELEELLEEMLVKLKQRRASGRLTA